MMHPSMRPLRPPCVVVASAGGPYDDAAFHAGYTLGALEVMLDLLPTLTRVDVIVGRPALYQLDLTAMAHGWVIAKQTPDESGEWVTVVMEREK